MLVRRGASMPSCWVGRRIDCSQRGTGREARLVAISQILLGQLGRVQTKIFQELPRLPRAIQDGQAGQATRSSFWPQDPKTSQDNPAHSAKLDCDLRRPTNDDSACRRRPRQSTHSPADLCSPRLMATADGGYQGVNWCQQSKQGTGPEVIE